MIPQPPRLPRPQDLEFTLAIREVQRGVFFDGVREGGHFYFYGGAGGGGAVAEGCGAVGGSEGVGCHFWGDLGG